MPERVQLSEVLLRLEAELRRKAADGCSLPAGSRDDRCRAAGMTLAYRNAAQLVAGLREGLELANTTPEGSP